MLKTPCAREEQKQLTRIFDTWAIPCLSSQLNLKVCGCSFGQNILARPAGLETVVTSRVRWSQLPPAWRADAAGWRVPRRIPAVTRNTGLTDQVSPLSMYSRPEASCHAPADWLSWTTGGRDEHWQAGPSRKGPGPGCTRRGPPLATRRIGWPDPDRRHPRPGG